MTPKQSAMGRFAVVMAVTLAFAGFLVAYAVSGDVEWLIRATWLFFGYLAGKLMATAD